MGFYWCLVINFKQLSYYYRKYIKPNQILSLAGFCHYILVPVPSVTQEITKDKWKKQNNLHIYFNIIFFNIILVTFALTLLLILKLVSYNGVMFLCMWVMSRRTESNCIFLTAVLHISEAQESPHWACSGELQLYFPPLFLIWLIWVPDLQFTYSLPAENEGRKRGKLPPHHQLIWKGSTTNVKIKGWMFATGQHLIHYN